MVVTEKGQVTLPKRLRDAARVLPGGEVSFSLDGGKIVITPVSSHVRDGRRAKLREAAKVRSSMAPEFRQSGARQIVDFLRGDDARAAAAASANARVLELLSPAVADRAVIGPGRRLQSLRFG